MIAYPNLIKRSRKLGKFMESLWNVDVRILWLWGLEVLLEKICLPGMDMGLVSIFCAFTWLKTFSSLERELNGWVGLQTN